MSRYQVIFDGTVATGCKVEDVKSNLAALFKIDEKKAALLFTKPQVILKKGLDYDSALKYRKVLLKTGAVCNVKNEVPPAMPPPVEDAAPPDPSVQALQQAVPPALPTQSSLSPIEETADLDSAPSDETSSEKKSINGVGDLISGVVIIAIGLTFGGSVFLGNPGILDYFFDGLGVFWIGRGIYKMVRK